MQGPFSHEDVVAMLMKCFNKLEVETAIKFSTFDSDGNFTVNIPTAKKTAIELADMQFKFNNLFDMKKLETTEGGEEEPKPDKEGVPDLYN